MALSEEVAWVTGSSTGIGRAVAVALAEGGRRVVVHYNASEDEARQVVGEIEGSGGEASLVGGDVSDAHEVGRMVVHQEDARDWKFFLHVGQLPTRGARPPRHED